MTDPVALHRRATEAFGQRVAAIDDRQWAAPTPCSDWQVRDLVNHLVNECLWVPPLVDGQTIEQVGDKFDGDVLGDDPKGAWKLAADGAAVAVAQPGAMERIVHLSFGDVPGSVYTMQMVVDLTVHAWDLARGIGADDHLPDDLVEAAYNEVKPQMHLLESSGMFAPSVAIDEANASMQEKLLALLGRDPRRS